MILTLERSLGRIMDKRSMKDVSIIIDRHPSYNDPRKSNTGNNWDKAVEVSKRIGKQKGIKTDVKVAGSGNNRSFTGQMLQTNDFVTASVKKHAENNDRIATSKMHTKVKRIKR